MSKEKKKDDAHAVPKLAKITGELHAIFKRGTADVIQIGRLLTLAKKEVGHGEFLPWLDKEFSLSEKSAQRYMAAHKFMVEVAAPLLKSAKLSDLHLRPSALYGLVEIHSRGAATEADLIAVLSEAAKNWIGTKRLMKILESRHPVETTAGLTGEAASEAASEVTDKQTTGEATDMAMSAEDAGEATGKAHDDQGEQSPQMPPDTSPHSATSAKDTGNLLGFAASVLNLKRLATGSAKKYAATAVQTADLETVADFVRAVADLKTKQRADTSTSAESSAKARKAQYAEAEAA